MTLITAFKTLVELLNLSFTGSETERIVTPEVGDLNLTWRPFSEFELPHCGFPDYVRTRLFTNGMG